MTEKPLFIPLKTEYYDRFRIVRHQYFNEKAVVARETWLVEEWRKRLWWWAWRPLSHWVNYGTDSFGMVTEFDSLDDARACIDRLNHGFPRQESVFTPVDFV